MTEPQDSDHQVCGAGILTGFGWHDCGAPARVLTPAGGYRCGTHARPELGDRTIPHEPPPYYDNLFDAAPAAQEAADATGVSHHVRKERATGLLVVQPTTPVDGRRFLTVWGPAEPSDPHGHLAHARYLGADAALAAASWLTMSEADAISILDGDGDPGVLDRYPKPNLSGEWADVATPDAVASEVGECPDDCDGIHVSSGPSAHHFSPEQVDEIATAWEQGRDGCWSDAVEAFACRVVGNIPMALAIEASNEAYVASLRTAAGL